MGDIYDHYDKCCLKNLEWQDGDFDEERYECTVCGLHWDIPCSIKRHWDEPNECNMYIKETKEYITAEAFLKRRKQLALFPDVIKNEEEVEA
tara:strand:+ start:377 stop:652 length:276 start_codon:yes stop_codon:yes gene_type:complete